MTFLRLKEIPDFNLRHHISTIQFQKETIHATSIFHYIFCHCRIFFLPPRNLTVPFFFFITHIFTYFNTHAPAV